MKDRTRFWTDVSQTIEAIARQDHPAPLSFPDRWQLSDGQRASLLAIARRLPQNGIVIADEVGMGKTRLAAAVIRAVIENKGRVAVVIPPGLGFQWADELRDASVQASELLRSLWQYFSPWDKTRSGASAPWAASEVVLISHAFANWRLGESSQPWRWTVLPHVYAKMRKGRADRLPNGFRGEAQLKNDTIESAAQAIIDVASRIDGPATKFLDKLLELDWAETLAPGNYAKVGKLRAAFEQIIGLGLGEFDLVVIDEAHKSRHADTGLAKLVERAMWTTRDHRRIALTATPVELHPDQWKDILHRVQAPTEGLDATVDAYASAVRDVRLMPSSAEARHRYAETSRAFEAALQPYLLRRDKREDEAVRRFVQGSKLGHDAYRQESEVRIDPCAETMSLPWRRAICAAEALSHIRADASDLRAKRIRLTIGSGHGVASLLDNLHYSPDDDGKIDTDALDEGMNACDAPPDDNASAASKRAERHDWWQGILRAVSETGSGALYDHPAILAAVRAIESATGAGEKVLVFGRYTRPLRALVRLLNAREMCRVLGRGQYWPTSTIDDDEWQAAQAAYRQLGEQQLSRREDLEARLSDDYRQLENARERFRRNLLEQLAEGLDRYASERTLERTMLDAIRRASEREQSDDVAILARALHTLGVEFPDDDAGLDVHSAAGVFVDLIGALRARDEGDDDGDGQLDDDEATDLWETLADRLRSEFSRSEGDHARLMYGGTAPATRRLLQLAFNREHGNPRALVAQSMVGREGLNLHKACRTVVLLHPEWNPGVVEQQIGRVDRIGSRWQRLCQERANRGEPDADWPRINIRPVIFQGTYDEQNWAVLRERWRDLRAQLHGIVLQESEVDPELREIVRSVNAAAPSFSPVRADQR